MIWYHSLTLSHWLIQKRNKKGNLISCVFCDLIWSYNLSHLNLTFFYISDEKKLEEDDAEAIDEGEAVLEDAAVDVADETVEEQAVVVSGPHTISSLIRSFLDAILLWIPFSFSLNACTLRYFLVWIMFFCKFMFFRTSWRISNKTRKRMFVCCHSSRHRMSWSKCWVGSEK